MIHDPHRFFEFALTMTSVLNGRRGCLPHTRFMFDALPGIDNDLKSGLNDYAIAQRPAEMGYYGVKFAVDAIRGKPIPPAKATGVVVMNKSNIDDPNIR
ncbi:hypothetical protein ACV229_16300 [Burkholderia sp. MR1-5-21]